MDADDQLFEGNIRLFIPGAGPSARLVRGASRIYGAARQVLAEFEHQNEKKIQRWSIEELGDGLIVVSYLISPQPEMVMEVKFTLAVASDFATVSGPVRVGGGSKITPH